MYSIILGNSCQRNLLSKQFMVRKSTSPVFTPYRIPLTLTDMDSQQNMNIAGMLSMLIQKVDTQVTKLTQLDTD